MVLPKQTPTNSRLQEELLKKTNKLRTQLNKNSIQSEGGNFVSGVQKQEKNKTKIKAAGAHNRMLNELKAKLATKRNLPALREVGKLTSRTPLFFEQRDRFDPTKHILVNTAGRPFVVYIPAQMRDENKALLSSNKLRPSLLNMSFLKRGTNKAVFGAGYYNRQFFGLSPPTKPASVENARCAELRRRLADVNAQIQTLCK
jgi:hypothetical protein